MITSFGHFNRIEKKNMIYELNVVMIIFPFQIKSTFGLCDSLSSRLSIGLVNKQTTNKIYISFQKHLNFTQITFNGFLIELIF